MNPRRLAGVLYVAFPLVIQIPFTMLTVCFDYPDVLRRPPSEILVAFERGGSGLIAVWYGYALSIALFVAALSAHARAGGISTAAKALGYFSAAVQCVALLRWTFLVPALVAARRAGVSESVVDVVFQAQHQFLGVGLGEHLGQLTLAVWTLCLCATIDVTGLRRRLTGRIAATVFLVGLGESYGTAIGADVSALASAPMVGFLLWSGWLVDVGIDLYRRGVDREPSKIKKPS